MEHLRRWKLPLEYMGEEYYDYYVLVGRSRDSRVIENANFDAFLEILGGESSHVIVARAGHWAVGWVESLMIHKDAPVPLLETAEEVICALSEYPVINDDLYSKMLDESANQIWNSCYDLQERVELCRKYDVSIFAARRDNYPCEPTGGLYEELTADC